MRGSDLLLLKSLVQEWIDYIYDRDINKVSVAMNHRSRTSWLTGS